MGLLKTFKRMFSDAQEVKSCKEERATNDPQSSKEAAIAGGCLTLVEELPMQLGLQPAMIDMMSSGTLTISESNSHAMRSYNNPYFNSESSKRLPAAASKENAKQSVSFSDATCSPRIGTGSPAASVSRFSKNTSGALKATPPSTGSCTLAWQPMPTSNEPADVEAKTGHARSCTAVPEEPGRDKSHRPVRRGVSLKNVLQLESYSFISDVDCSEAQQAVDSSDSDEDKTEHQYQSVEHFDKLSSNDKVSRAVQFLLSPQKAANRGLQHSASSDCCGPSALLNAHNKPLCLSRMSRGGNVTPPMSGSSADHSGLRDASCILTADNDDINELLSPCQKEPKNCNVLAVSAALPRSMKRSVWSVKDYVLAKKLHNGYASKVFSADCKASSLRVVLKVYKLEKMDDLQRCQLFREVSIHSKLQHQNIVQFHCAFTEENCVIIVQEFAAGGDLLRYMYGMGGRLTEKAAVKTVLQPFLCALHYLHTEGIIHRDIKPENCLLTGDMVLQIADFGLAVDLKEERANTRAGTLDYMAPEVLRCPTKETPDQFKAMKGAAHYEMAADSWAVGAFAYELLCGKPPFRGSEMSETAHNIIKGDVHFPEELTTAAVDFISCCLEPNPANRLTVIKMLNNPWIKMFERRKTTNNLPDSSATTSQQSIMPVRHSPQTAVKPSGIGRLAFITKRLTRSAASSPGTPPGEQKQQPMSSPMALARVFRRLAMGDD